MHYVKYFQSINTLKVDDPNIIKTRKFSFVIKKISKNILTNFSLKSIKFLTKEKSINMLLNGAFRLLIHKNHFIFFLFFISKFLQNAIKSTLVLLTFIFFLYKPGLYFFKSSITRIHIFHPIF